MGLFHRRPLCFFCMLFLVASYLILSVGFESKLRILICLGVIILLLVVMSIILKKIRGVTLTVILCLFAVILGVANSAFRMDYQKQSAEEWIGKRNITASVTDIEYTAENSATYMVKIEEISENQTNIKALLVCGFGCELDIGDMIFAYAEIMQMSDVAMGRSGTDLTDDTDALIMAVIYDPSDGAVQRFNRELTFFSKLFVKNGLSVAFDEMKDFVRERTYSLVGEETGSVINGFLIGDTSDIPTNIIRDFRRSGVSHLFAVSGLHISILLGAIDFILRKLTVHRNIRCAVVSVLAFVLLIFTGFSMSALRSVLMLWIVYLAFLFSEEADSPTTLFVSVTLIILIFPYAVFELGMWMSFLATLGLVTVYPMIDEAIPKSIKGGIIVKKLFKIARAVLMVMLMTVISNVFLLPIQWGIFGEISAVAVPTNILLSPLNSVLLVFSVLCLLFGGIPVLGEAICLTVKAVCEFTLRIVGFFSSADIATVSLEYNFATPIVIIFTVAMIIVITVKLRRKWIVALPFCGFILAFTAGIVIFNITTPRSLTYYGENTQEVISVTDGTELCVIDMSNGAYGRLYSAFDDASQYGATDVDTLILTTVNKNHISSMEYFFRSRIIRKICIPVPTDKTQLENSYLLADLAYNCGVEAYLYESGEVFTLGDTSILIINTNSEDKNSIAVFVNGENTLFGYSDAFSDGSEIDLTVNGLFAKSNTVLIGNNGVPNTKYSFDIPKNVTLIYASRELAAKSRITSDEENTYVNPYDCVVIKFKFK